MNAEDLPLVLFLHALYRLKGVMSTNRRRVYMYVHPGLITIHFQLHLITYLFSMKPNYIYHSVFIYQNEEMHQFIYIYLSICTIKLDCEFTLFQIRYIHIFLLIVNRKFRLLKLSEHILKGFTGNYMSAIEIIYINRYRLLVTLAV